MKFFAFWLGIIGWGVSQAFAPGCTHPAAVASARRSAAASRDACTTTLDRPATAQDGRSPAPAGTPPTAHC